MTKYILALTLALVALPSITHAQTGDSAAAPAPVSPAQKQAMGAAIQAYRQKAMQMHEQLRTQILDVLSPDQRTAVANAIGQMVISPSPDPAVAAKQIDAVLTPDEQQKILAAHDNFVKQSQAMLQQLHAQFAHQAPNAGHWTGAPHPMPTMPGTNDAGNVVLMVLAHHSPLMDRGGMPMGPPPPGAQPPNGPPGGPPPVR